MNIPTYKEPPLVQTVLGHATGTAVLGYLMPSGEHLGWLHRWMLPVVELIPNAVLITNRASDPVFAQTFIGLSLLFALAILVFYVVAMRGYHTKTFETARKRWMSMAGMALLLASLMTTGCADRLTPDQVMIDNFQKNKPAFEELVTSYLQFPPPNNGKWDKLPRVIELKQVTGVERIIDGPGYWFEDPYSLEAAQKMREMDENKSWHQFHDRKPAIIRMPEDKGYGTYTIYFGNSSKDYFYYPADPKVESGRIVPPRELDGRTYPGMRVLDSLNAAPGGRSDCYLRKIEPRWFIQRCDIR